MARPLKAAPFAAAPFAAAAALACALGACSQNPLTVQASLDDRACLARVMYFESNRSSEDGMLAVGTVVMNRLQSPRYPKTICGVVGQPNQFAEGALSKPVGGSSYVRALKVADAVIAGERHDATGSAMFFHTAGYTFPYRNMHYLAAAGGNVFYEKKTPGTFEPVPATAFADATTARPLRAKPAPVQVASGDEDEPAPVIRAASPRRPAPGRPVAVASRDDEDDDELPAPRRAALPPARAAAPPPARIVVASLAPPARRHDDPPTIAELIELDMGKDTGKTRRTK